MLTDSELDLSMREADIGIRLPPSPAGFDPAYVDACKITYLRFTWLYRRIQRACEARGLR